MIEKSNLWEFFRDLFSEKKVEDYEFKCLTALFPYRPKPSPTSSRISINL
jgi:hypothetical protein